MHEQHIGVVIDMVSDFVDNDGLFAKAYGLEDTQPVRCLLSEIESMLATLEMPFIECTSKYVENQFRKKSLATLCTTESGCASVLNPSRFVARFTKTSNSLFTV